MPPVDFNNVGLRPVDAGRDEARLNRKDERMAEQKKADQAVQEDQNAYLYRTAAQKVLQTLTSLRLDIQKSLVDPALVADPQPADQNGLQSEEAQAQPAAQDIPGDTGQKVTPKGVDKGQEADRSNQAATGRDDSKKVPAQEAALFDKLDRFTQILGQALKPNPTNPSEVLINPQDQAQALKEADALMKALEQAIAKAYQRGDTKLARKLTKALEQIKTLSTFALGAKLTPQPKGKAEQVQANAEKAPEGGLTGEKKFKIFSHGSKSQVPEAEVKILEYAKVFFANVVKENPAGATQAAANIPQRIAEKKETVAELGKNTKEAGGNRNGVSTKHFVHGLRREQRDQRA